MSNKADVAFITQRPLASTAETSSALPLRNARIFLSLLTPGNRARLKEHLSSQYQVIEPVEQNLENLDCDLAIIDTGSYAQWKTMLLDIKHRNEPAFFPIILILSRSELKQRIKAYWDLVDEFIVTPIDRLEFSERVAMLLRARHLALTQQAQLAYLSTHDRVTGLPNKALFKERLHDVIVDASVTDQSVQVLVLKFTMRHIISSLGHRGLDRAATLCTSRLKAVLGAEIFLARLTTESWGLIFPAGHSLDRLLEECQKLVGITDNHLEIENERIHIDVRIGVGLYPEDAADAERTLDCAINALSSAHNSVPQFYAPAVQNRALRYIRTEARLRDALQQKQFELWYQPQIRLEDMSIIGAEALVRWRLPSGQLVPPGEFLSVAESSGLIVDIDRWVLQEACKTMQKWRACGLNIERVAVNITAEDLQVPDFSDFIQSQLELFELPPPMLELELTESTLLESNAQNLRKLNDLRAYGMNIAIDDFGTGYSSLSYLHKLPINILKIDQSFIRNILSLETDAAITQSIIWLARKFKLATIAEGVETLAQARYLQSLKVDIVQGYYYARPMPEADFRQWLASWTPPAQ